MACLVSVEKVAALANPLTTWPWRCAGKPPVNEAMFRELVLASHPIGHGSEPNTVLEHTGRIRFLMERGWDDPILIDVGIPALNYWGPPWPVIDGNHRLAAALLRGDREILVEVDGQLSHAADLFAVLEAALIGMAGKPGPSGPGRIGRGWRGSTPRQPQRLVVRLCDAAR